MSKSGNSGKSGMSDMSAKSGKSDSQGRGIIPTPLALRHSASLSKPNVLGNTMGYNSTTVESEARSGNTHRLIDSSCLCYVRLYESQGNTDIGLPTQTLSQCLAICKGELNNTF